MKQLLFLLLAFTLLCTSCKKWQHKYPEDTERTKKTPEERLTGKTWTLTQATLNGIDYTDSVYQKIGKYQLSFTNQALDHVTYPDYYAGSAYTGYDGSFSVYWGFYENKEFIEFDRITEAPFHPSTIAMLYIPDRLNSGFLAQHIVILKLSDSEFKISRTSIIGDSTVINTFISN